MGMLISERGEGRLDPWAVSLGKDDETGSSSHRAIWITQRCYPHVHAQPQHSLVRVCMNCRRLRPRGSQAPLKKVMLPLPHVTDDQLGIEELRDSRWVGGLESSSAFF